LIGLEQQKAAYLYFDTCNCS